MNSFRGSGVLSDDASIIDRGRGPEIAGTRITVYDIWDYARQNWHRDAIALTLPLPSAQVFAALEYIEQHKDEVLSEYDRMVERDRREFSRTPGQARRDSREMAGQAG